jgi:hypothetical protein
MICNEFYFAQPVSGAGYVSQGEAENKTIMASQVFCRAENMLSLERKWIRAMIRALSGQGPKQERFHEFHR